MVEPTRSNEISQSSISSALSKLVVSEPSKTNKNEASDRPSVILCDMGYGLPKETRPRKEKILAICRQLYNFLHWQREETMKDTLLRPAQVRVVECPDLTVSKMIQERLEELWKRSNCGNELPEHFSISCQSLSDSTSNWSPDCAVYLSPDAEQALDIQQDPPRLVVVGLLIDRRPQPLRSAQRASKLELQSARWPLETVSDVLSANEPLNVDCVLEGMQQWYWNVSSQLDVKKVRCFQDAAIRALQHHQKRHPERPQHLH